MARMKWWRVATLAAIPLVLLTLQSRYDPGVEFFRRHSLRNDAAVAVRRLNTGMRIQRAFDSVSAAGGGLSALTHGGVTLRYPSAWPRSVADSVSRRLQREVEHLPARTNGEVWATVLLVPQVNPFRVADGRYGAVVFPGHWAPCTIAPRPERALRQLDTLDATLPPLLGQCALAAFGTPGSGMRLLLERMRLPLGAPAFGQVPLPRDGQGRLLIRPDELDWDLYALNEGDMLFFGCRAGDEGACRKLLTSEWHATLRGDFIWWLMRQGGHGAFGRFWKADGDPYAAARTSFGMPLTALLSRFMRERVAVGDTGPRPPAEWPISVASVLGLSLLVSLAVGRRRTIA